MIKLNTLCSTKMECLSAIHLMDVLPLPLRMLHLQRITFSIVVPTLIRIVIAYMVMLFQVLPMSLSPYAD